MKLSLLLTIAAMFAAPVASASTAGPGTVHNIYVMDNGVVLFHLTGSRTAPPTCGTYFPERWAFDGTGPVGQARLSLLLTAYTAQKPIAIHGTSTCPDWLDTETVSHFMTAD